MKFRWFLILPLVALAATLTAPADAQESAPDTYPFRGISFGPRFSMMKPETGGSDWTGHGGAQLRFHLTPIWALEASGDYRRRRIGGGRVDIYPVQASLLAYLFPNPFHISPYLLAGASWHFTHVDSPLGEATTNRFGGHAGGGLQVFLNRKWSLDGSYRHFWLEDIAGGNVLNQSFDDDGHQITAALNYHF